MPISNKMLVILFDHQIESHPWLSTAKCPLQKGIISSTVIGSQGIYLSGGEAQRLAIARAMLKNAPVLILDEATAFADPDNETKVQAAFNELAKGRTVIMIAHRLSTIVNADRIFVLNEGHLSESGSFAELSGKKDSLFGTMWQDYQQSVRWKVEKEV